MIACAIETLVGVFVGGAICAAALYSSVFVNLALALIGGALVLIEADGGVAKILSVATALFNDALGHPGFTCGSIAGAVTVVIVVSVNR